MKINFCPIMQVNETTYWPMIVSGPVHAHKNVTRGVEKY